ncbi:DUF6615 family protein [Deferribacteres bacterium DY0037]
MYCKDQLRESSLYVRKWISRQPHVNEESITDWLLFEIEDKIPGVYYTAFTHDEDAKITGADWEWWFIFHQYSIRLRIQAKKLKEERNNYNSIAYKNAYGFQIDKLLDDAQVKNYIPLYALYVSRVKDTKCGRNITDEGGYLAGAKMIKDKFIVNGATRVSAKDLLSESIPLSCLCGCPNADLRSLSPMKRLFQRYFKSKLRFLRENSDINSYFSHEKLPKYVEAFLDCQASDEQIENWEESYKDEISGFKALLVFDTRRL